MASAAVAGSAVTVAETSPKAVPRGFYQAFRATISHISVNERNRAEDAITAAKTTQDTSRETKEDEEEAQKSPKPKSKYGKKKEIVSSSTVVPRLEVCTGKKCKAKGSEDLLTEFRSASDGRVEIAYTKCMKECKKGMNVRVTKDGTTFEWHNEISTADVEPILCKHFDW